MLKVIEKNINNILQNSPKMKKIIKRSYQIVMYTLSPKIKSEGDIQRISPDDGLEYFFGYYDKTPWDATDRYMLALRAKTTYKSVAPDDEPAEIILFDTQDDNSYRVLGKTNAWNVQQGCMLQWLGPDYKTDIVYNDFRNGNFCSIVLNIMTNEEKTHPLPIYSVAANGEFALSLDFTRLHRLGKGYGYSNLDDLTINEKIPDKPAILKLNLHTSEVTNVLSYKDFFDFEQRIEMQDADHILNHIMISPDAKRFMVLHRWIKNSKLYTRLITANIDGSQMYNLSDNDMVSHCFWKNNNEIVAYERKFETGDAYYLMKDKSNEFQKIWHELSTDGHPSFSPSGKKAATDTYPNRSRVSSLYIINQEGNEQIQRIARTFSPFRYDNVFRCDLHPRWNRAGNMISFDATFEGKRGLYVIKAED